jgi:hypothetical protein
MFMGLLPAALYTHHMGKGNGTGPSGRIMSRIAGATTNPDGSQRLVAGMEDDFNGRIISQTASTIAMLSGTWLNLIGDGGTVASDDASLGGVLTITNSATNNHEMWLKGGVAAILGTEAGDNRSRTFFEARVSLPTGAGSSFVGLTAAGIPTLDTMGDNTPFTMKDQATMGFKTLAGVLYFIYKKSGVTAVQSAAIGPGALGAVTGTHNLGFIYDQRESSSHSKLEVFVDNQLALSITGATLTDATTPVSAPMGFTIGQKGGGVANVISLDWAYCYSLMD